ncbi:SPOR domain-containing protein [Rhizorhapis sp. SPR117]|uniref:SPOR domain-containing protein n=1 Tax=Rhizorhapis sp. SPR117 TaxID=2912611 RepID=UPI001F0063B9|nr:SPOR domain-containing protein [Rhizorhapis sp. SPR117]
MKQVFLAVGMVWLAAATPVATAAPVKAAAINPGDVKAGVEAWERGDYPAAIKLWRPAATAGDADAQFNLGQAYKLGWGVPMDMPVATEWFRKAAVQGHIRAEDNYGLLLFRAEKRAEAMPYIEKSSARGEPRAQYILGTALFNGENVAKDWPRAYAMMTRAVASGLPQATNSLALMDQYIPLDQRQAGTRLAAELEAKERSNMLAATQMPPVPATPPASPTGSGKPTPIKPTELPPSTVASPAPVQQAMAEPVPAPPAPAKPKSEKAAPEKAEPAKPAPVAPVVSSPSTPPVVAAEPKVAAMASPRSGDWRIQLGAFSEEAKARTLWTNLLTRVTGLDAYQPYLVKQNALTRLQAGPFVKQADALKVCETVRSAKADCIVKKQ